MKVAFRVDASLRIGTGHIYRCLTLALQLRYSGIEAYFFCRSLKGHLCDILELNSFQVLYLPAPEKRATSYLSSEKNKSYWLEVDSEVEIKESRRLISELGHFDWLVIDHYGIDHVWESAMRPYASRIMVIDDLRLRYLLDNHLI